VTPPGYLGNMIAYARGRAAAAAGDLDRAVAQLEAAGSGRNAWGEINPASNPWRSHLALAYAEVGRAVEAAELAAEEVALARAFGAPRAIGMALHHQALLDHGERRIEGLRGSERVLGASAARLEHGRTLLDLGAALRRAGQRSAARSVLATALDRCHSCGAHVLAERARAELHIVGARPRRERLAGPEALTPAELRVAKLAADGMTNRQIAQALFLTTKTVETHLSHTYPKLDITSRSDLKRTLGRI
jgi:DNA-binding CsgD family transcriptional regulator